MKYMLMDGHLMTPYMISSTDPEVTAHAKYTIKEEYVPLNVKVCQKSIEMWLSVPILA
jgi:hypothetical protein